MREVHPEVRLRARVREHPIFEDTTLGGFLDDPLRLDAFLAECRAIPHCGETQVIRLRAALVAEICAIRAAGPTISQPGQGSTAGGGIHAVPGLGTLARGMPVQGHFHPDFVAAIDEVYLRMCRLAPFHPFVYAPSSVPEFAKVSAVRAAELLPRPDVEKAFRKVMDLRRSFRLLPEGEGLILMDPHALSAIFARCGRYAVLDEAAVASQRDALHEMLALLPAGIDCAVVDFETAQVSSAAIIGDDLALYAMGGYTVLRNPEMAAHLRQRCHAARRRAQGLSDFLDACAGPKGASATS